MNRHEEQEALTASIRDHLNNLDEVDAQQACIDPERQTRQLQDRFSIGREEARRQLEGWLATTRMNAG